MAISLINRNVFYLRVEFKNGVEYRYLSTEQFIHELVEIANHTKPTSARVK